MPLNSVYLDWELGPFVASLVLQWCRQFPDHPSPSDPLLPLPTNNNIYFNLIMATIFTARHDPDNKSLKAQYEQTWLLSNFFISSLKGNCLFYTSSFPFTYCLKHTCRSNEPEMNRRIVMTLYGCCTSQTEGTFWRDDFIEQSQKPALIGPPTLGPPTSKKNRSLTMLKHYILGSHFYNTLTYAHLIYHASTRFFLLCGNNSLFI